MQSPSNMRVTSVNLGPIRELSGSRDAVRSAIDKAPQDGRVQVDEQGLAGDAIEDPRYHGGVDQAVYLYSADDYAWWSAELRHDIRPGTFGENLTIAGLPSDPSVGDRLVIGRLVLEITGPRVPCHKLGLIMQDAQFPARFADAGRPGAYCRVLNSGSVGAGDSVSFIPTTDESLSLTGILAVYHARPASSEALQKALATPLAERLREKFASRLKRT